MRPDTVEIDPDRAPDRPLDLRLRSWPATLRRTASEFADDHLVQWAAALTFFAVLSIFPAMLALVSVLALVGSSALQPLIENVSALAPGTARAVALDALTSIERNRSQAGPTLAFGVLVALWIASAYVGAFIPASNVIWDVHEARPLLKKLVVRLVLTVVLLLLIALTAVGVVLTGPIAREVGGVVGLGEQAVAAWSYLKWPFLAAVVTVLLAILYWAAPNVRHPGWRWLTPGSVLAVVLWILASIGFTLYVNHFGAVNATYGEHRGSPRLPRLAVAHERCHPPWRRARCGDRAHAGDRGGAAATRQNALPANARRGAVGALGSCSPARRRRCE